MTAFVKGILSNFVSKTLVAVIGLLTVILVSRYLGPEGRGEIGLFMSSVALLQLFCDFGNSTAIINLSYKYAQRRLWNSSLLWITGVCLLSLPILVFTQLPYKYFIAPAALLLSVVNLHHLLLMGKQEVHKRNISLLVVPVLLLIGFFLSGLLGDYHSRNYILAFFLALLISVMVSYRMVQSHLKFGDSTFVFEPEILRSGVWIQSAQAIQFLNYRLNFFLVAFFISEAALGVYNNAVILCESIWILGHSMAQMQHMKILNTVGESQHFKITEKIMTINFFGTLLAMLLMMLLPTDFWSFLFGNGFEEVRPLFLNLASGVLAFSVTNIISHGLHAANKFKTILVCNLIGLICGGISALVLIPENGIQGAANAWSIGLSCSMTAFIFVYYWQNIGHYNVRWHIYIAAFSLVAAFCSLFLSKLVMHLPVYDWANETFALELCLFLVVFFSTYFIINLLTSGRQKLHSSNFQS